MTKPLSPAAQAVLRAAGDSEPGIYATIAAALRAAADQVDWDWEPCSQLLAIAAELEAHRKPTCRELMREPDRQPSFAELLMPPSRAPATPKPDIIPKPQFPSPRKIREDFLP